MMGKVYFRLSGVACQYPPSKKAARREGSRRYDSGALCSACSDRQETTYARFVDNDGCIHCSRLAALEAYKPHYPGNVAQAKEHGTDHYWRPEMCVKAGHVGKRTLEGQCYECYHGKEDRILLVQNEYPDLIMDRATARSLGFTVYRTGRACRRGHRGYRYLSNNGCLKCKGEI